MKTLIATRHFHLIEPVLAQPSMASALLVGTIPPNGASLLENITRYSSHCLVVLGSPLDEDVAAVLAFIEKEMPDVRVVRLPVMLETIWRRDGRCFWKRASRAVGRFIPVMFLWKGNDWSFWIPTLTI
jgi:hypothetical protein